MLLTLAGCGGTHSSTPHARTAAGRPSVDGLPSELRLVKLDPSVWRIDFGSPQRALVSILPGGPPPHGIPDQLPPLRIHRPARSADSCAPNRSRSRPGTRPSTTRSPPCPIAVTYCPLCNSAIMLDRHAAGRTLAFGTTGNLRNSDLVMWDRPTQNWWQQFSGEAIVGSFTGTHLTALDSQTLSLTAFRASYPQGDVLSRDTGFQRPYGQNPTTDTSRTLDRGRSTTAGGSITVGSDVMVVPFDALRRHPVTAVTVGGVPGVVLFDPRVLSPLDELKLADSRQVGTAAAFDRRLGGRTLAFQLAGLGLMTDLATGSHWDITGRAITGPLRAAQLRRVHDLNAFWFAVAASARETGDRRLRLVSGGEVIERYHAREAPSTAAGARSSVRRGRRRRARVFQRLLAPTGVADA